MTASEAMAIYDRDGRLVMMNKAMRRFAGREDTAPEGLECRRLMPSGWCPSAESPCETCPVRRVQSGAEMEREELTRQLDDGRIVTCEVSARGMRDADGRLHAVIAEWRDVTENRRMDRLATSVSLMESLGYIFSGIRHELGNPVNTIKTTAGLIHDNIDRLTRLEIKEYSGWLVAETKRLEYLLQSLRSYSLFDKPAITTVDLSDFIAHFLRLVDTLRSGVDIRSKLDPGDRWIRVDPRGLHQALLNLVVNSVEALGGHSHPEIKIQSGSSKPGWIELTVADNGPGMSEDLQKRIFTPFYTTKREGSGLGLPITQRIVVKMGGKVKIVSTPGSGTRVTLIVPAAAAPHR